MMMRHSPRLIPRLWAVVAAIVFALEVPSMCEAGETTRRLFLDDHHIHSMTGLSRVYHQPVKDPAPVIVPDKPWETNGWVRPVGWYPYGSHTQVWLPPVWNPELSKWQLWYQGGMEGLPLYAESTDGVNWVKPNLGLVTWGGNTNNNIILLPPGASTAMKVIRDTFETNPSRRYKTLSYLGEQGLARLISPDGKTWTREGSDVIAGGDEYRFGQDPVTGQFRATVKLHPYQVPGYTMPADYHPPAYRLAWLRTSSDFVTWTPPQLVAYGSTSDQTQAAAQIAAYKTNPAIRKLLYDQPSTLTTFRPTGQSGEYTADVYNMPLFRYQDMFLGLPTRMLQTGWLWPVDKPAPANNDGWAFPYLVSSRDLTAWNKHTGNPFCDISPLSDTQKADHGMVQKLYRATKNKFYAELLRDIAHNIPQYLSHPLRMLNPAHEGWMCERVVTADWSQEIDEISYLSTWPEAALALTNVELPGLYINTTDNYLLNFDNIKAEIMKSDKNKLVLSVTNPTKCDARVKILAENAVSMQKPLGEYFLGNIYSEWIKAGETKQVILKK